MLPDRVSNPGPLTYESGALPIALRGPANSNEKLFPLPSLYVCVCWEGGGGGGGGGWWEVKRGPDVGLQQWVDVQNFNRVKNMRLFTNTPGIR